MPRVSVIITAFNSGNYIRETLLSILAQGYQDFEIIVVDDASTDNTAEVVGSLDSEKIRYIKLPENHGGPSKARNIGIGNARGEFIDIIDSDDLVVNGRIESAVRELDSFQDLGMVFTDARKFDEKNGEYADNHLKSYDRFNSLKIPSSHEGFYIIDKQKAFDCLFYENFIQTSSVTIRKQVFEKVGLFDETLTNADDWDMWFRIAQQYDLGYLDSVLVKYRIREGSISQRAAGLGNNKIKVLRKRLELDLDKNIRLQAHRLISLNYEDMGYAYRCMNQMQLSKINYKLSLKEHFKWSVLRQYLITYLGFDTITTLKRIKKRLTDDHKLSLGN